MSNRFANPTEVCQERGWKRDTPVKDGHGNERIIVAVSDEDWIVTRLTETGHLSIWGKSWDITDWTEDKPPVVTIERQGRDFVFDVLVGGKPKYRCHPVGGNNESEFPEVKRILTAMAEAGKAAIEADHAKPAKVAEEVKGPYTADSRVHDDTDVWVNRDGGGIINIWSAERAERVLGIEATAEIIRRHAREIASELNALHAKASQIGRASCRERV